MSEPTQKIVLLADDDIEIRRIVRRALSKLDCQIIEARDGEEALEQLILMRPDVVVLDVMMPTLNGWEICKYIREHDIYDETTVLMLTAIGPAMNELTAPLYGADAYMDKPFDIEAIQTQVRGFLEHGRPGR